MNDSIKSPEFRFYYFTNRYTETIFFYKNILQLQEMRSWNRADGDKGTIFLSPNGKGWIEIEEGDKAPVFERCGLYIEVDDVDKWFAIAVAQQIKIIQPLKDTSYGHRSFKFADPNNLEIGLFKYNN